jgi:hypothetical protein
VLERLGVDNSVEHLNIIRTLLEQTRNAKAVQKPGETWNEYTVAWNRIFRIVARAPLDDLRNGVLDSYLDLLQIEPAFPVELYSFLRYRRLDERARKIRPTIYKSASAIERWRIDDADKAPDSFRHTYSFRYSD